MNSIKDGIFEEGRVEYLAKIPAQNLLPAFGIYYSAYASEHVKFDDEYLEYGLSPISLEFVGEKVKSLLKEIPSEF